MTIHADAYYRTYNCPDDVSKVSFSTCVRHWAFCVCTRVRETPEDECAHLGRILDEAWTESGIRCHVMQLLAEDDAANTDRVAVYRIAGLVMGIIKATFFCAADIMNDRETVLAGLQKLGTDLADLITLVWMENAEIRPSKDSFWWKTYQVAVRRPCAFFERVKLLAPEQEVAFDEPEPEPPKLFPRQQAAFDSLRLLIHAKRCKLNAGGIAPTFHTLILGPSGSGKSHVVRAVAKHEGMGFYEINVSSWLPSGSRTQKSTPERLAAFVDSNRTGIIFLDEADKLHPKNEHTSDFTRFLIDELFGLLDARVSHWEGWSEQLAIKLKHDHFIVLAGAWQQAYNEAFLSHQILGGSWANLSIREGFLDNNWLPTELLNRVSSHLIEILPPDTNDIIARLSSVRTGLGLPEDQAGIEEAAKEIMEAQKGIRGIEEYLITEWFKVQTSCPNPRDPDDIPF